ncbi:hypothetical protein BG015_004450 [Linnemannia schmuckeri]|uniref:Uncharacterized protein n=1 Tax=Linnemannia schmuckeri TaxID=64567 RepID=A0A9P5VFA2_9FUNG|nr:hypothetical protein BG015_004450 [Linnemannia schmuckeri]
MAFRRFSSLHAVITLSVLVLFWMAWTNVRLRESDVDGSNNASTEQQYGGRFGGALRPPPLRTGIVDRLHDHEGHDGTRMRTKEEEEEDELLAEISSSEGSSHPGHDPELDLPYVSDRTTSPLDNLTKNFTIVTAASANHFCALESFLYSMSEVLEGLERSELRPKLVVYNLGGMSYEQMKQLQHLKDTQFIDEYKDFNYAAYPAFWDINKARGEYGWKAGIIKEVADTYGGLILWLDSGNMLALDFLRYLPGYLDRFGFWSPQSSGSFRQYTHEGLPQFFGDTIEPYAQETNCNGAAIAFDASNDRISKGLLKEWYRCSSIKACIAPKGSSRANHRQDQAALTYLVKKMHFVEQCRHFPEHYGVTVHQDKVCRERIRAYKIMKGLDEETDYLEEEVEEDEEM